MVVDNKDATNGNGEVSSPPEIITSDIDTSDWLTYRNEELGFSFKYPSGLGELEEVIISGDSGLKFTLSTKNKPSSIVFSGITSDYSVPRGGSFSDSQGYEIDSKGQYNFIFVGEKLIPFTVKEVIEAPIGNVVIVNQLRMENSLVSPGRNNIGALVNLEDGRFRGLSVWSNSEEELIYEILRTLSSN